MHLSGGLGRPCWRSLHMSAFLAQLVIVPLSLSKVCYPVTSHMASQGLGSWHVEFQRDAQVTACGERPGGSTQHLPLCAHRLPFPGSTIGEPAVLGIQHGLLRGAR